MIESNGSPKWLTWNKLVILVAAGFLLGRLVVNQWGYFVPPLLPYTNYLYLLLWLPVLIVGILLRPAGKLVKSLIALVVFGLVFGVLALALFGPDFNYTSGTCQSAPLPDQPVRYECLPPPNYQGAQVGYVLIGQTGSPFVKAGE